jgi:hypothetical protein
MITDPLARMDAETMVPPDCTSRVVPLLTVRPDWGGPLVTLVVGILDSVIRQEGAHDYGEETGVTTERTMMF